VWGTTDYIRREHKNLPTVFFGLYDLRDYIALWRHRGQKWVLWAGSDLRNLDNGFAFNDGKLKWLSMLTRGMMVNICLRWIRKAEHYVENQWEADILKQFGIESKIVPSFLGKVEDFPVSYKCVEKPNVYISTHKNREMEYGVDSIFRIAREIPEYNFHIYGIEPEMGAYSINITFHGRVSQEQMNGEIKDMQCGLRLNETDGFSEITAKSILMGQYPITRLEYPLIPNFEGEGELISLIKSLPEMKTYNEKGREYYLKALNNYPWNVKKHK
jgi:hypothetical protein